MIFFKSALPSDLIVEFNDVARAVNVPLIGALQPAEFFKIILTMTLAHIIYGHNEKYTIRTVKSDTGLLIKIDLASILPLSFFAVRPDLGSTPVLAFFVLFLLLFSVFHWGLLFMFIFIFLFVF